MRDPTLYLPIKFDDFPRSKEYSILNLEDHVEKLLAATDYAVGLTEFGRVVIIKYGHVPLRFSKGSLENGQLIWELMSPEEMLTHDSSLIRYFGKVRLQMDGGGFYP